jgi:hypothetical protein
MHSTPPLSTELALRAFEADQAFSTALAAVQSSFQPGLSPIEAARKANAHGFAWLSRPCDDDPALVQVMLRHQGGAETAAVGDNIAQLLAGLLGIALQPAAQTSEPEVGGDDADPVVCPAVRPAAPVDPEPEAEPEQQQPASQLLDDQQKATAVAMCKAMDAATRKAFTISFRDAFRVDRDARSIIPLITELKHLEFIDRFSIEAAGGISE